MHLAQRSAADRDGDRNIERIGAHEHHVGSLDGDGDGDVAAGADGDADAGFGNDARWAQKTSPMSAGGAGNAITQSQGETRPPRAVARRNPGDMYVCGAATGTGARRTLTG